MKLLSWRIKKQQAKNTIYKIRNTKTQKVCNRLKDIQKSFELYYKDLYTQPNRADIPTIKEFLDSLDLPSIGEQQNKILLAEITWRYFPIIITLEIHFKFILDLLLYHCIIQDTCIKSPKCIFLLVI